MVLFFADLFELGYYTAERYRSWSCSIGWAAFSSPCKLIIATSKLVKSVFPSEPVTLHVATAARGFKTSFVIWPVSEQLRYLSSTHQTCSAGPSAP